MVSSLRDEMGAQKALAQLEKEEHSAELARVKTELKERVARYSTLKRHAASALAEEHSRCVLLEQEVHSARKSKSPHRGTSPPPSSLRRSGGGSGTAPKVHFSLRQSMNTIPHSIPQVQVRFEKSGRHRREEGERSGREGRHGGSTRERLRAMEDSEEEEDALSMMKEKKKKKVKKKKTKTTKMKKKAISTSASRVY